MEVQKLIENLLVSLAEGSTKTLRFSSFEDRESFRKSLYRYKKSFDDLMICLEDDYKVQSLRFKLSEHQISMAGGKEYIAELSFYVAKAVKFSIDDDSSDDNTDNLDSSAE